MIIKYLEHAAQSRVFGDLTKDKKIIVFMMEKHSKKIAKTTAERRNLSLQIMRDNKTSVRDIGKIPKIKNKKRRESCRNSLELFISTYFPQFKEWGEPHKIAIAKMQDSILHGTLFALAMSRGHAKSTLAKLACIWAISYGHRKYVLLIQATAKKANQELKNIKALMETSKAYNDDFPSIMFPVRKIEGQIQRCKSQLIEGQLSYLEWSNRIKIAVTKESIKEGVSESIIETVGITAAIRGSNVTMRNGKTNRPDFFLLDDVQEKESCLSDERTNDVEAIVREDVMGCAGMGVSITGFCLCTIVRAGDMASRLLDRETHPEWQGEKTGYFKTFPTNMELWREWLRIKGYDPMEADAYYKANEARMLEGAEVTWQIRHEPGQNPVLHGMELWYKTGEKGFMSEYQNEPLEETQRAYTISPSIVASRIGNHQRYEVPTNHQFLTVFADVMQDNIRYVSASFRQDYSCAVIDYGEYLPTGQRIWDGNSSTGLTEQQAVAQNVSKFLDFILLKQYKKDDKIIVPDIVGVDCGYLQNAVADGISIKRIFPVKMAKGRPNKGWAIAKDFRKKGENYYEKLINSTPQISHNADYFKKSLQQAFLLQPGVSGSASLYLCATGHRQYAQEICNEQLVCQQKDEYVWHKKKGFNHFLDCSAGCFVLAEFLGCSTAVFAPPKPKRKISFASGSTSSSSGNSWLNSWR